MKVCSVLSSSISENSLSEMNQSELNRIEEEEITRHYPKIPRVQHNGLIELNHCKILIGNDQSPRNTQLHRGQSIYSDRDDDSYDYAPSTWNYNQNQSTYDRQNELRLRIKTNQGSQR